MSPPHQQGQPPYGQNPPQAQQPATQWGQQPPPPAYPPQAVPPAYPPQGAYPYPYPPPVMYAPPQQPGKTTFEGLGRLKTAIMLVIGINVIYLLMAVWALTVLPTIGPGNVGAAFGAIAIIALFGILVIVLGIVALIFAVWGLTTLHSGRAEFGADHSASVKKGVNFVIFGIVAQAATFVVGVVLGISIVFATDANALRNTLLLIAVVGGAVGVVSTLLYGLGMQFLLEKLMTFRGRNLKMPFLGLAVGGSVVALVISVAQVFWFNPFALQEGTGIESLAAIISLISLYVYFMQLKEAEQGARNMIQSGQFNPDAGGPAPMSAPPMA